MLIPIRVTHTHGKVATVRWHDGIRAHKTLLPRALVRGGFMERALLTEGVDVDAGRALERYLYPLITSRVLAEAVAEALRARDIWTTEDVPTRVTDVRAAFAETYRAFGAGAYGTDMAAFIRVTSREA
jgi:hypothetical protein